MLGMPPLQWLPRATTVSFAARAQCPRCPRSVVARLAAAPSPRPFSSTRTAAAAPSSSSDVDHYRVLDVPKEATRKQIKERFYDVSRGRSRITTICGGTSLDTLDPLP
jgi:hypothetical protein